jgi:hypothetical protein
MVLGPKKQTDFHHRLQTNVGYGSGTGCAFYMDGDGGIKAETSLQGTVS